nr:ABC transporter permease [uncultured Merdimonas sp.]
MRFLTLLSTEFRKIRRSRITLLLLLPLVILWLPNIVNADMSLTPVMEGISPEHNFLIQSYMGFAWFIFPASMIVCTVMLQQLERGHKGILKMLALPLHPSALSLCKFIVLLVLAFLQTALMTGMYFVSAWIASRSTDVALMAGTGEVFALAGILFLSSLPMLAVYWMLAVCLQTPVFSITVGLASMVPTVLMINVKAWYLYPPCYPFYIVTWKYGEFAGNTSALDLFPWIPAAAGITLVCIIISCLRFGQAERR